MTTAPTTPAADTDGRAGNRCFDFSRLWILPRYGKRAGRRVSHTAWTAQGAAHRNHRPPRTRYSRVGYARSRHHTDGRTPTDERRYAPTSDPLRRNPRSRSPESVIHFSEIPTTRGDVPLAVGFRG